ncbi:MAG: zinc-ribbon domain-containing protein [Deltaproteobacteria bacterium]|nr:zinc-ribbon domain-containing protein [Deltaproteobacteria bacterium]
MIITCSQCQTRFKVGDDKLASGPIRVRCSKCNFVFMASGDGGAAASQPPSGALPATTVSRMPTGASFVPPSSPTPRPSAGPITGMFKAFPGQGEAPSPSGFGSATNRSGIFRAPSSDFRPPPSDPFAGLAPPSPQQGSYPPAPSPSFAPPSYAPPPAPSFAPPAAPSFGAAPDPFARTMTPGSRSAGPDPFANVGLPPAPDPFGAAPTVPSTFPPPSMAPDPFGGQPTAAATPHAKDPFGLGAASQAFDAPPAPSASSTAQTEGFNSAELFGAGARAAPDPFGAAPSPQQAGGGDIVIDDPFAAIDAAGSADSMVPTGPPAPPLPPPEEGDPFADLGLDTASPSLEAQDADPFDRPPQKPTPAATASAPAASTTSPPAPRAAAAVAPVTPPADRAKLERLESAQRVRAVAWAAVQLVIFAAFVVVAVVLARGGTLADLARGDVAAALGGTRVEGDLAIEHPRIRKRTLPSGLDVVVVSGEVHNTTSGAVPGARVEVKLGAEAPLSGWAWSTLDGVDVEAVATPEALVALSQRTPTSASLAPGERAPFVVVGRAPADGLAATFSVQVTAPPPR